MSTVLCVTSPARGHLFPVVPVLLELQRRGHDVAVRTLGRHCADLNALGLRAAPLDPATEALVHDDWRERSPMRSQARAMDTFARRAPLEAADLRAAITAEQPDLLLVDSMAFGAVAEAEASGLPWATWLPYPAWLRRPGVPPFGPGLPPMPGPLGRLRDALVAQAGTGPERRLTAAANVGRSAAGLPPVEHADDVLLHPPLVLALTAEPFEYPGGWPASFRLVGPLWWEPPVPEPDWLAADDRPVVLVSTSSEFQDDGALARVAVQALADRGDVLVVVTLPADQQRGDDLAGTGVRVERFVAHSAVLPRASVVVCHAGAGITLKALAHGVPVCAVPFGRDQLEVARRVERSGAGTRLPRRRLSPERLRAAVADAEGKWSRAQEVGRALRAAGGAPAAVDALESVLVSGAPASRPA
jgi:MGT family glycosyltransferase